MERWQKDLAQFLPQQLAAALRAVPPALAGQLQEIRLRVGKPVLLCAAGREMPLYYPQTVEPYVLAGAQVQLLLECMADYAPQMIKSQMQQGFFTLPGGYRIGLCGRYTQEGMGQLSGMMVRIARQVAGAADFVMPYLQKNRGACHTLVLSPPGMGKTTLLRDIARQFSYAGLNVAIVDERSEIAGCRAGEAQLDVGPRTDVLDGCPKETGLLMMLRTMAPQLILCDEVGSGAELSAIADAAQAGVAVIASAHARNFAEFCLRPPMRHVQKLWPLERVIVLGSRLGPGTVECIADGTGRPIWRGAWRTREAGTA